MILLLDIGNTHTHVALGDQQRVRAHRDFPTEHWRDGRMNRKLEHALAGRRIDRVGLCSVVPSATLRAKRWIRHRYHLTPVVLGPHNAPGIGIDYPRPETIGPDRLANAAAVVHFFGAPAVVVDFGTAVTFDVVDRRACYIGGIIAPGLGLMTQYLHEKTALLPAIEIRETAAVVGRSTEQAMLIGAVHGYRALIAGLLLALRQRLRLGPCPVVATGGYAALLAAKLPQITAVRPRLTLEGIRLAVLAARGAGGGGSCAC